MRRLWIGIFAITLVAHVPFVFGLSFVLARASVPLASWIAAAIAMALALALRGRVAQLRRDVPLPEWRLLFVEEPYYAHWCATIAAAPLFVVLAIVWSFLGRDIGEAGVVSYAAAFALSSYGVVVRRRRVRVRTIDVPIAGLDAELDGYRIAQLSDLHIGGLWPRRRAQRWIDEVNRLDVDLVTLTGDYVTSGTAFHEDIAAVLSAMRGRDGVIAIMGNHDYFGDGEPLITLLRKGGVVVLRNERRLVSRGRASFTLAGIDDTWTRRADIPRALDGRDMDRPLIVLAHDPRLFPALAKRGAALVLSGHTHWGQVAMPFVPERYNLSRISYRYHAGLYHEDGARLYVNPGLGTTGPPVRIGAPPEITVLRLSAAPRS